MDRDYGNQQGGGFGNQQGGGFGNEQGGDDAGGASNDGKAREGMQMTVTTWTKCLGPLD